MKVVVLESIDGAGKTTAISELSYETIKYPLNPEIKDAISKYYKFLARSGKELHDDVRKTIYQNIHDLYDMDFRKKAVLFNSDNIDTLVLDRYFISNVVYSKMNDVYRPIYAEEHQFPVDLVIYLKVRDYPLYKKKFIERGDALPRDPAVLYKEVQPIYQNTLKELLQNKIIKKYQVIEALQNDTLAKIKEAITLL